jgi:phosphomannomutase
MTEKWNKMKTLPENIAKEKLNAIFKAYDIRGIVGENLDEDIAYAIGAAFVKVVGLEQQAIVVGYDMRDSSVPMSNAFARGVIDAGASKAIILGLISTDGLYFAGGYLNIASAMFTASHNPAKYNGIKLSRAGAQGISKDTGLEDMRDYALKVLTGQVRLSNGSGQIEHTSLMLEYAQHIRKLVPLNTPRRPIKIVVDAANGMAGYTVPHIFGDASGLDNLPLEIVPMYFELDGSFPNHEANPLEPENLKDLQKAVLLHNADLGLAFDGDADRCFIIDEKGKAVNPSAIGAVIANRELKKYLASSEPLPPVLYSLTTSRFLKETIESLGAEAVRIKVGHSPAKARMAETQAIFGGEHSAHYYFREFWGADSGVLAAMHIIAELIDTGLSMSEISSAYSPYFLSGEINTTVDNVQEAMDKVVSHFKDNTSVDFMDGVFLEGNDESSWFWISVRPSNTEPLLRLNVESNKLEKMEQIRDEVLNIIRH